MTSSSIWEDYAEGHHHLLLVIDVSYILLCVEDCHNSAVCHHSTTITLALRLCGRP